MNDCDNNLWTTTATDKSRIRIDSRSEAKTNMSVPSRFCYFRLSLRFSTESSCWSSSSDDSDAVEGVWLLANPCRLDWLHSWIPFTLFQTDTFSGVTAPHLEMRDLIINSILTNPGSLETQTMMIDEECKHERSSQNVLKAVFLQDKNRW